MKLLVFSLLLPSIALGATSLSPTLDGQGAESNRHDRIQLIRPDSIKIAKHREREARALIRDVGRKLNRSQLITMDVKVARDQNKPNRNRRVEFHQVINGIPLKAKSKIVFDQNGNVLRADFFTTTNTLPAHVGKRHALELAKNALEIELAVTDPSFNIQSAELQYISPRKPNEPAFPEWKFKIAIEEQSRLSRADAEELKRRQRQGSLERLPEDLARRVKKSQVEKSNFTVRVNANDGTVQIAKQRDFVDFTSRVCQEDFGTLAGIFGDPGRF